MTDYRDDDIERAVRGSLRLNAEHAPNGDLLADGIIAAAQQLPAETVRWQRRGWRTWGLPLIAAGSVGAVIAAVTIAVTHHPSATVEQPVAPAPSVVTSTQVVTPTPSKGASTSATSATSARPGNAAPVDTSTLHDVTVEDVTFVSADEGWALGAADCIRDPGQRCTAMLHTTDGRTWQSMSGPLANVPGVRGCADPCVEHIRFATSRIGYAYGPVALFTTSDGGRTWQRRPGGALSVETLDGNVIRVTATSAGGCPGPCGIGVETAAVGGSVWTTRSLGGNPDNQVNDVQLVRGGSHAYLLFTSNPAGGGNSEQSTLFRSADDGRTWTHAGEPCPQTGGEVDSRTVAAGPGAVLAVLCSRRTGTRASFVVTSDDGGANFTAAGTSIPLAPASLLAGDPHGVLLVGGDGIARSSDGGRVWRDVPDISGTVTFLGFENASVGRALSDGGRTVWTTRDGGRSWSEVRFG